MLRRLASRSSASSAVKAVLPTAAPGEAGKPLAMTISLGLGIKHGVQKLIETGRIDAQHGGLFVDQFFLDHIDGDLHRGGGVALAVAGLQHVELAFFDGEFEILHVADSGFRGCP